MTRKSKARYGMNRTYKLNPAVKALRNALFAGMAMAAVAPAAQAACVEVGNVITCSGEVGFLTFGPGDFTLPFDPTTVILDATNNIVSVGPFGVFSYGNNDNTLVNLGTISVNYAGNAYGMISLSDFGDALAQNQGSVDVTSANGVAVGIYAGSNYGDTSTVNSGDISAYSATGNAFGMVSYSPYGDASAQNDGSINAESWIGDATGILAASPFGDVTVSNGVNGSITAYTFGGSATGINAQSLTGDVSVVNDGIIDAESVNLYATGIVAQSIYGAVSVSNTGTIDAYSNGVANGIDAYSRYDDVSVHNSGDITVTSRNGDAYGVYASSYFGNVNFTSDGGSISAYAEFGDAFGVLALSTVGDVSVDSHSDILAQTELGFAAGIYALTYYNVSVSGSGDIDASTTTGNVVGIAARSTGDYYTVTVDVSGDISAHTSSGNATGIFTYSYSGEIDITSTGVIDVETTTGSAIGIRTGRFASSTIDNSGNIYANTVTGSALGILADSYYDITVTNGGDIKANTNSGFVRGIAAQTTGFLAESSVTNSGDIEATSAAGGSAQGIRATSSRGYVSIDNTGDVLTSATNANALSIVAVGQYGVEVTNGGYLEASSNLYAFGVYANSRFGDTFVTSTGDILAESATRQAMGIYAKGGESAVIDNTGDITANADLSSAYGAYAYGQFGVAAILNSGDINVTAYSDATGLFAKSLYSLAYINNSGDVSVDSAYGIAAYGLYASAFQDSAVILNYGGDISASSSYDADASAIVAVALDNVTVYNSGVLNAYAYNGDAIGIVGATTDGYVHIYNNGGNIYAESINGNAYGIYARSTYAGDIIVGSSGTMDVSSENGLAFGIYAKTTDGDISVGNYGNMTVYSEYNLAAGILASADYGDVFVGNTGILHVESGYFGDAAVGIYASGKYGVEVVNQGAITALSTDSTAAGIFAKSADYTSVYNNAAIVADSYFGIAVGISARGLFDVEVTNTASINAHSEYSLAEGIGAISYIGDVTVTNSGDLTVVSDDSNATGILAAAPSKYSNATVINSGAITAIAYGDANGIHAFTYNGDISITNGTKAITASTTAYHGNANGIYAESNSGDILIASNGAINVVGDYATGINAITGSYSYYANYTTYTTNGDIAVNTGTSSNINAYGFYDAYGINAEAAGSVSVTNAGSILATAYGESAFSVGIRTESGYGTTISNSGTIDAAGDNAWAIVTYADGTTITNSATGKIIGDIWTSANDVETDSLTNNGKWYVGERDHVSYLDGTFFGGGDDSIVNSTTGKIFMDDSYISMGYSEGSTNSFMNNGKLYANNDNSIYMGGNGSVFTNNGASIHMEDGDINDSLTIYGDFAGTGHIVVDADGANLVADRLYIEGNVVTNTANVIDVELLSLPSIEDMLDSKLIEIVHVSGTSTAANFSLGIVTPPFDEFYTVETSLIKDINYNPANNDLFSLGFEITGLAEAGILASTVSPAIQNLWTQASGNVFQREGTHREFNQNPDGSARAAYTSSAGVWARYYGASGSITPEASHSNFGSGGSPNFDQEFSGWEAGVGYAFNSQWSAGLLGGTSESTIDPEAGGRLKLDAETLGAYVMYTPGNGLYFDLSYRGMNFDGNSQGGSDSQFSYSGDARGFSFEMGYGYKTSNGLIIEPQLQYSAVSVEMDTLTYNSADFELKDGDAALLRIGAAIRKSYKTSGGSYWTPYGALSYLDASDSENSYEIGGLLVGDNDTSGGSVLAEAGVTGFVGKWGMSGGINWRNGGAYDGVFGGQVSVRYDW